MANNKKPSIYQDRGTIGSTKELDEYGVWVKSEPQVLPIEDAEGKTDDFSLDSLDDLPDLAGDYTPADKSGPDDADFSLSDDNFNFDDFDSGASEAIKETEDEEAVSTAENFMEDFSVGGNEEPETSFPPEDSFPIAGGDEGEGGGDAEGRGLSGDGDLPDLDFSLPEEEGSGFPLPEEEALPDISLPEEDSGFPLPEEEALPDISLPEEETGLSLPGEATGGEDAAAEGADSSPPEEAAAPEEESETGETGDKDSEDFAEISLEALLGEMTEEMPGGDEAAEDSPENPDDAVEAGSALSGAPGLSGDMSTQLLMKIADELSSIRTELNALKKEFAGVRAGSKAVDEQTESHGFFDDSGEDDKIALTGDELNNILTTADFTAETGQDATEEALPSEFPEVSGLPDGSEFSGTPEFSESPEFSGTPGFPGEETPGDSPQAEGGAPGLDKLDEVLDESFPEIELPAGEESAQAGPEEPKEDELSLVDLFDEHITEGFSIPGSFDEQELSASLEEPGDDPLSESPEITLEDISIAGDSEALLDDSGMDLSLDNPLEEADLANFDGDTLDLTGAVIDEPNLGAEIQENPILEPDAADIAIQNGDPAESMEQEPEAVEEPSLEPFEEPEAAAPFIIDEIEGEAEISMAKESAAAIPAVRESRSRGEGLDQIIPEGFLVADQDDEGEANFGGAGLDTLEEGISLDEIPEDILPENNETPPPRGGIREEPEVPGLPGNFKKELKQVLSYMDQLLESLPEEKIEEFAKSEYFDTYKKLFKDLGIV
jgi:hypothetical protein